MDLALLYKRVIMLVTKPASFWSQVKEEDIPTSEVRRSFLLPIILLVSISSFAGTYLYSYNSLSLIYPLLKGLEYFLILFITTELVVFILSEITVYLLKIRIYAEIYKLVIYSVAPFMLMMIISKIFSSLLFLNMLGLYGLLILWMGIDIIVGGDKMFRIRLTSLIAMATIVFYLGIRWIISALVEGLYFTIFG